MSKIKRVYRLISSLMDGSILTSTLSSTSNVDRRLITSDFARNSFREGSVELHFCTLVAVNVGKIAENREKRRIFGKFLAEIFV